MEFSAFENIDGFARGGRYQLAINAIAHFVAHLPEHWRNMVAVDVEPAMRGVDAEGE